MVSRFKILRGVSRGPGGRHRRGPPPRSAHPWRAGNTAVEFALLMPVLFLLLAGAIDYGWAINKEMQMTGAVRAALQYAERYNNNFASVDAAVLTKIQQVVGDSLTANGISSANVTTTVTEFCECSDGTTLSCALTCSGGSYPHAYIKVTADLTYTPFINFANIANSVGLGGGSAGSGSTTLRSSLTARIQ